MDFGTSFATLLQNGTREELQQMVAILAALNVANQHTKVQHPSLNIPFYRLDELWGFGVDELISTVWCVVRSKYAYDLEKKYKPDTSYFIWINEQRLKDDETRLLDMHEFLSVITAKEPPGK